MNKKKNYICLLSTVIIGALWIALVLIFGDFENAGFYYWGGFGFGIGTFVLAALAFFAVGIKASKTTIEMSYVSAGIVSSYEFAGIVINTIYCVISDGEHGKFLVALNLIIIVALIIALGVSLYYTGRTKVFAESVAAKSASVRNYSAIIGGMLGLVTDPSVKGQLLELKKNVDYGASLSRNSSDPIEAAFYQKLLEVNDMIVRKADAASIENGIEEAIRLYKGRNSAMQSL